MAGWQASLPFRIRAVGDGDDAVALTTHDRPSSDFGAFPSESGLDSWDESFSFEQLIAPELLVDLFNDTDAFYASEDPLLDPSLHQPAVMSEDLGDSGSSNAFHDTHFAPADYSGGIPSDLLPSDVSSDDRIAYAEYPTSPLLDTTPSDDDSASCTELLAELIAMYGQNEGENSTEIIPTTGVANEQEEEGNPADPDVRGPATNETSSPSPDPETRAAKGGIKRKQRKQSVRKRKQRKVAQKKKKLEQQSRWHNYPYAEIEQLVRKDHTNHSMTKAMAVQGEWDEAVV